MARALNYIVLLSIVGVIVAASGCSSNTSNNNTQAPATTTSETQATPVETVTSAVTPASAGETPGAIPDATERNLQIEQNNAGVTSTVSNGTLIVKVSENSYGLETNPLSTAKKNTNPFNNTGNDNAVAVDTGKLKIIPAEGSTTNTSGNQTIHIGSAQRKLQIEQAAQSGNSGSGASQSATINVTVNTASITGY